MAGRTLEITNMNPSLVYYDIILTAVIAAFYLTLYVAARAIWKSRSKAKPTKGNPFQRRFKAHELQSIVKHQP